MVQNKCQMSETQNTNPFPEINKTIKRWIELSYQEPTYICALARIEKLERERAEMIEFFRGTCNDCEIKGFGGECYLERCELFKWRNLWLKKEKEDEED